MRLLRPAREDAAKRNAEIRILRFDLDLVGGRPDTHASHYFLPRLLYLCL